jgi:hypothetical protein
LHIESGDYSDCPLPPSLPSRIAGFCFYGTQRVSKTEYVEPALKVGETIRLSFCDVGAKGVVVERLNQDYVRVKWSDFPMPTVHSDLSLCRFGNLKAERKRPAL